MGEPLPLVLSTEQLAAVLHVSTKTVRGLVKHGKLRRLPYSPRVILVHRDEVERFLAEQAHQGEVEP